MDKQKLAKIENVTNSAVDQIANIYSKMSLDVISVIARRLKNIGNLTGDDITALTNLARVKDLNEIEKLISDAAEKSVKEIDNLVKKSASMNDELLDIYYEYKKVENVGIVGNEILQSIVHNASESMVDNLINLSKTTAIRSNKIDKSIRQFYAESINYASVVSRTGLADYQTMIRKVVNDMDDSGVRVIDFDSGYSRRIDSQVRMNLLDSVRLMNDEYRREQGREFGADGVEVSAHGLCAKDHIGIQGKQFSLKKFDEINSKLDRPIGTMNCSHFLFPIVLGVSSPTHSKEQLKKTNDYSNKEVSYKDKNGEDKTKSRYDASQVQRRLETDLRRLDDKVQVLSASGAKDAEIVKYERKIASDKDYLKSFCKETGLTYHSNRTESYIEK